MNDDREVELSLFSHRNAHKIFSDFLKTDKCIILLLHSCYESFMTDFEFTRCISVGSMYRENNIIGWEALFARCFAVLVIRLRRSRFKCRYCEMRSKEISNAYIRKQHLLVYQETAFRDACLHTMLQILFDNKCYRKMLDENLVPLYKVVSRKKEI